MRRQATGVMAVAVLAGAALATTAIWGQFDRGEEDPIQKETIINELIIAPPTPRDPAKTRVPGTPGDPPTPPAKAQGYDTRQSDMKMNAIRNAAYRLRHTEGEAGAEAEKQLQQLLHEYFDADLRQREEHLAQAAARLDKLRALLERRREKKEEIIELQMKVLENEAEGLGFFNPPPEPAYRTAPLQPGYQTPQPAYRPRTAAPQLGLPPQPATPPLRDPQRDLRQRARERALGSDDSGRDSG